MDFFFRNIPPYLYKKRNSVTLVLFTAVFAVLFIFFYRPFNSDGWYDVSSISFFGYSALLVLIGVAVVIFSRWLLYHYSLKHKVICWQFLLWIAMEIVAMSAIYTLLYFLVDGYDGIFSVMMKSVRNTALVIAIPYLISVLYFSVRDYSERLKQLDELQIAAREASNPTVLSFPDSKGETKLSIKRENLLYIEAADNYVNIWYRNKGNVEHYMLRNTLKETEKYFDKITSVMRCHRSYIVNFENVNLIRREKDGVFVDFGIEGVPSLPVSSTYLESVSKTFLN